MKTQFYLIPLLFFLFVACSGDDDSSRQQETETQEELPISVSNLEGEWLFVERKTTGILSDTPYQPVNPDLQYSYVFEENGIVQTDHYEDTCNVGTYQITNESLIFEFDCTGSDEQLIDSLTSKVLILKVQAIDAVVFFKYKKTNNPI